MGCCPSKRQKSPQTVDDSSSLVKTLELDKHPKRRLTQNVIVANKGRSIEDFYELNRKMVLGSGISGQVKIGVHKETRIQYAIKSLSKRNLRVDKLARLQEEIRCMAQLDHPNILRLHEYFENDQVIYLVLELCTGGELLDRLHEQQGHHYSEKTACRYIHTMLNAITYCHAHNIVHRDLKLENFLFEDESPDAQLKLIDFGLSHYTKPQEVLHRAVGTPYYVAPEVLEGNYDYKCDIWSIGVIAYMLVSGTPPFYGKNDAETLASVKLGRWHFDERVFKPISSACKDFISKCLTRRPHARPTAAEALKHKWFRLLAAGDDDDEALGSSIKHTISLDVVDRLTRYVKRSQLSKIIMDVVAHTLLPEQIGRLRDEFATFDVSKSGEITLADMRTVLKQQTNINDADLEAIFRDMDIDQTGLVSYHEFIAATISRQKISENNLKIAFERMSSHNETISGDRIKSLLGNSSYDLKSIMEEVGLEEEAELDYDQFKNIMYGELTPLIASPAKSRMKKIAFFRDEFGNPVTPPEISPVGTPRADKGAGASSGAGSGAGGGVVGMAGVGGARKVWARTDFEPVDTTGDRPILPSSQENFNQALHATEARVTSAPGEGTMAYLERLGSDRMISSSTSGIASSQRNSGGKYKSIAEGVDKKSDDGEPAETATAAVTSSADNGALVA